MITNFKQHLIPQSSYAKTLRPMLPKEAFEPDINKLVIFFLNIAILLLGWTLARQINHWPVYLLPLYLPFAVIMANSVIVLLFSTHDIMHGSVIRQPRLVRILSLVGFIMLWMPPTLWKNIHNRIHHNQTNSLDDPDRGYLYQQPNTLGKRLHKAIVPSNNTSYLGLLIGLLTAWGVYAFRNTVTALLGSRLGSQFAPATFTIKPKERRAIFAEFLIIFLAHLCIIYYLRFGLLEIALAYFLPISIGYAGLIFYIYTNHLFCSMTSINDPLVNSISIKVPKIFDTLHLNFSYHAEHHIFPSLNSDYYPMVRELLRSTYPERMGYIMPATKAWHMLISTPRLYKDGTIDWSESNETLSDRPIEIQEINVQEEINIEV